MSRRFHVIRATRGKITVLDREGSGVGMCPLFSQLAQREDGVHVVGYGILSYGDARLRWSRDEQDHMCATQDASHKLLCVYRKPKTY